MVFGLHRLSFGEFISGPLESLSWYDLGGDLPLVIADVPGLPMPVDSDLTALSARDFVAQVQVLSAQALIGQLPDNDPTLLRKLAFQSSQVMSRELNTTGDRRLRMWAQRLNYALQPLITMAEPPASLDNILGEEMLVGKKPWDALDHDDRRIWISSDRQNLHLRSKCGQIESRVLDLPTQIDRLEDGTLSIGSLYTDHAALLYPDLRLGRVAHDAPVLLVFDYNGRRCLIDFRARICDAQTREVIHRAPCQQVHFARVFGNMAYLLNNGDFGHITLVDLDSGAIIRQRVLPVQVCNDIVVNAQGAWLIDKQQGSIFAFYRDWTYRARQLSFGTGVGQLCDPVSLRCTQEGLAAVSWLSHKRTEISAF